MRFLLVFFFIFCINVEGSFLPAQETCVVDYATGKVIYAYNADTQTQPASLTKMMTLLLTFKALQQKKITLQSRFKISRHAAAQHPCRLGLKPGQTISVKDAILALVTKSANDIAVALGEFIAGNEKKFVCMMNREARRLKMTSTIFMNPSGWKNPRQLSTARDLVKLSRALIREYPKYYSFFGTKQFRYGKLCLCNHNRLLGVHEDIAVDGIKTGYVAASGFNLAASATQGNRRLIVVVLGGHSAKERDEQVSLLFKKGFARLKRRTHKSVNRTFQRNIKTSINKSLRPVTFDESERMLNDYLMYKRHNRAGVKQ